MTDVIEAYYEKLKTKKKHPKVNLPALARRDKNFMTAWKADDGFVFISQDVIALEPSITAEMSQDPMYKYATQDGIGKKPYYNREGILMIDDIYLMSASRFPVTEDHMRRIFETARTETGLSFAEQWLVDPEVCKDYAKKDVRNFAKVGCLGMGYGMGARKFRKTAEEAGKTLTHAESKATIEAYWSLFEGLKALRDSLSWEVKRKGAIVNPFGYRCTPEPHKALNAYIQSSASGVLDVYLMKMRFAAPWVSFVCLVHDEVIWSVPVERVDEFKAISQKCIDSLNADLGWKTPIRFGSKEAPTFWEIKLDGSNGDKSVVKWVGQERKEKQRGPIQIV